MDNQEEWDRTVRLFTLSQLHELSKSISILRHWPLFANTYPEFTDVQKLIITEITRRI